MPQPNAPDPKPAWRAESQWDLIWREFRKRRLAVVCLGVILLIVTSSILAPFIANDRPLFYVGYNRFDYSESLLTIRTMAQNIAVEHAKQDQADPVRIQDALTVIKRQRRVMLAQVDDETGAALNEMIRELITLSEDAPTPANAAAIRDIRNRLRREYGSNQVRYVASAHWPVFESLNWLDAGFITWIIAAWGLLKFRILVGYRPNWGRKYFTARTVSLFLVGLPIVAAVFWALLVPYRVDRSPYKSATLAAAESSDTAPVVFESVLWPPISYGIDEDDLDRKYAAPIWTADPVGDGASGYKTEWDGPHILGTDAIGRDVLSRMIWGGRVSLSVGIVAVSIYVLIGIVVGAVAGYFRGWTDMFISRIIEIVICFPTFFLILTIVAFLGPNILNIMIVIGLTSWTGVARLVRGEFLRLVEQEFVLAGRSAGFTPTRIIFRHVLPNAMAPVLVAATFGVAGAILTESALSFLGFGITVPTPSWGGILSSGRDAIFRAPWLIYFPGMAIFITITAYNLVGEAFRDASDPRLRGR